MNKLQKSMDARHRAMAPRQTAARKTVDDLPEYSLDGNNEAPRKKRRKWPFILLAIFLLIAGAIWLPAIFYERYSVQPEGFFTTPDFSSIKSVNDYTRNNPDEDFDDDGLPNHLEQQHGTSPRRADTDGDGVSDYAEIYITDTSPTSADAGLLEQIVTQRDREAGMELGTPYKIHEVVLWPADAASRAHGAVVRSLAGYRICGFTGWAQFPTGQYAYKLVDGVHVPLNRRAQENAWEITDDAEILLYDSPLEMVYFLDVAGLGSVYLNDDWPGKVVSTLLPSRSPFISCRRLARQDTFVDASDNVTVEIYAPAFDAEDQSRFGRTHNSLVDLAGVYAILDEGEPVLVSLNSPEAGEIIAVVYGYTRYGDLLLADSGSLQPAGVLSVEPRAARMLDHNDELVQMEWYEFSGLGFDSAANLDRISFLATA